MRCMRRVRQTGHARDVRVPVLKSTKSSGPNTKKTDTQLRKKKKKQVKKDKKKKEKHKFVSLSSFIPSCHTAPTRYRDQHRAETETRTRSRWAPSATCQCRYPVPAPGPAAPQSDRAMRRMPSTSPCPVLGRTTSAGALLRTSAPQCAHAPHVEAVARVVDVGAGAAPA